MSALFRPEAIEARRDRLTGTVVVATPPGSRIYFALLGGAFVILLLIAVFGSVARRESVTGLVASDRGIARVFTPGLAEIRQINVRDGQHVDNGMALLTVSVTNGRDQGGDGVAGQIHEIDRQDGELLRQQQLAQSLGTGSIEALQKQRANTVAQIASLERQYRLAGEAVGLANSGSARAGRLLKENAGSKRQVEDARAAALDKAATMEAIGERLIVQRDALAQVEAQIASKKLDSDKSGSELGAQRADLAGKRAALLRLDRLDLTAPVSGTVTGLNAQIGQRASPDASLLTVVPDGSQMEIWLYAPSRAAGFVTPGTEVRLMLDAFPYQKFGAGKGTVIAVSSVPTDPSAVDPGLKITEPVYRVRVRIDRIAGPNEPLANQIRPGMTLRADLVLERRSLLQIFLDPIFRAVKR